MSPSRILHGPIPATVEIRNHATVVVHIDSDAAFAVLPSRWAAERVGAERIKAIRDLIADGSVEFRIRDMALSAPPAQEHAP